MNGILLSPDPVQLALQHVIMTNKT
jgi:hypothetical protein